VQQPTGKPTTRRKELKNKTSKEYKIFSPIIEHEARTESNLEGKEGEDHEAEDGKGHHLRQLLHRVQQRIDDGLQACNKREKLHKKCPGKVE
jgi:hypothetical protein